MGISVGCAYDFSTGEYGVYMDDNIQALVDLLNSSDMVCAFNQVGFDLPLLREVGQSLKLERQLKPDSELINYDMLVESRAGAKVGQFEKGFKLDAHLKATLGIQKTGDGAMAPDLYQAGKIGELTNYCLADVHRERLLFRHMWRVGNVTCDYSKHEVRPPQELLGVSLETSLDEVRHLPSPQKPQ